MRQLGLTLALLLLAFAGLAFAGDTSTTGTVTGTISVGPAIIDTEPSFGVLIEQGVKVISDWRTLGSIAGLVGLLNLLVNMTKLGAVNVFLNERGLKWVRPLLAAVLGSILAGGAALQNGAKVPQALLAGMIAGLASSGFHEVLNALASKKTPAPAVVPGSKG